MVHLGETHLAGRGAQGLELLVEDGGRLHAEFQAAGILGLTQWLVGREHLEAVVPVGQSGDALAFHAGQQRLALGAGLEAVDRSHVIEQERQIENLHRLGVMLELGQRGRQHLDIAQQQGLHLLAVAEQRGVGIDLDLHPAGQAFFRQLLEQHCALPLGRVFGDDVGEFDGDGGFICSVQRTGEGKHGGTEQRLEGKCGHGDTSSCFCNQVGVI